MGFKWTEDEAQEIEKANQEEYLMQLAQEEIPYNDLEITPNPITFRTVDILS